MNLRLPALLGLLAVTPMAAAQSGQLVPTSSGEPDPKVLSLREMRIDVGLARGYARVNVRQVFENHTDRIQEGTYRFALAPSAAVGDFAVWDGTVRIPGVILEKARARAIYRSLTTQRIDPGLLQQGDEEDGDGGTRPSGGASFSVTVAPIPARATKRLELQFQQDVPFVAGQGEFRLALRPPSGIPTVAGVLEVHVRAEGASVSAGAGALPLAGSGAEATFSGRDVVLDRDLVVRLRATAGDLLRLAAFRNPAGALPDGLALAPWERPSEIPPEKDGFFLLEATPPGAATGPASAAVASSRKPLRLALLFDTSLSHRWRGLETAYARLVGVLQALTPADRFVLIPFDRQPAGDDAPASATPAAVETALATLRARPLGVGTDVVAAVARARQRLGDGGRIVLFTDGAGSGTARALDGARGGLPLFTSVGGGEAGEALRAASTQVLGPGATSLEADLFLQQLLAPADAEVPKKTQAGPPFSVGGGDPKLRDIYPVLLQPLAPGALSGWIGRYAVPTPRLEWALASPLFPGGRATLAAPLPETALEARDLPRRWARARVDFLLALIEAEGERREWVDEVIALSKRYKFVTPYTAFLAAPRSLLRPRRIQPGDPVLRVECDPGIVSATALFPFGLRLPLVRRPGTSLWEGRFLVPEGLRDGRYSVRVVLRDASGTRLTETKDFVIDGEAPRVRPEAIPDARPGASLRVAVRTDSDVIFLSARLGDGAPIPLRWDAAAKRSVGTLLVPATLAPGRQEVVFEAVDGANNHGFARAPLELRP